MFAALDEMFSVGTNRMAHDILMKLCLNAKINPTNTTYGIKNFGSICRTLAEIIHRGFPHDIYMKLDAESRAEIRSRIVKILEEYMKDIINVGPRYYFKDSKDDKPVNATLPTELFENPDLLFLILERTMFDIHRYIKQKLPNDFTDAAEEKYKNNICNHSLKCIARNILLSLGHCSEKLKHDDLTKIENISTLTNVLASVINQSMNYQVLIELSLKSKVAIRTFLADQLFKSAKNYENYRAFYQLEVGREIKEEINGITFDHEWGDYYSKNLRARFPKDLFENEDELKKQLKPGFQKIMGFINIKNFREVFKHVALLSTQEVELPYDMLNEISSHLKM